MTYPPFSLEKALAGEPVVYLSATGEKKAYIHQMLTANQLFIEYERGGEIDIIGPYTSRYIGSVVLGMWQEPVKFDHWDLIAGCIVEIRKVTVSAWFANSDDDLEYDLPLASSLFPDCPVGTIIKRPD